MNGKFTNTSIIAGIAALASGVSSAAADEMWAVSASSDSLFVFDSDTGATVRVVGPLGTDPVGYQTAVSMAVDDAGRIFIINNSPAPVSNLSRVDPETGRATHIGGDVFFSLSFGPDGQLFGLNLAGRLCTVDTTTGLTTSLGGPILPTVLGLDYNRRDGFLYGVTSERFGAIVALLRIDPATGDFTSIPMSTSVRGSAPGSIAFQRDGDLIMTENGFVLWEVDIVSGEMTQITTTADIAQGLGLMPCLPDFDASGDLDLFDFLAFQNAFDAGDPAADLDGDGVLTIFDFAAFRDTFDAGC